MWYGDHVAPIDGKKLSLIGGNGGVISTQDYSETGFDALNITLGPIQVGTTKKEPSIRKIEITRYRPRCV